MKSKPIALLLATIAVLLAANLFATLPEAKAQTHLKAPQLVDVAVIASSGHEAIVRIWSDGFADYKVTVRDPDWGPQVWTPLPFNPDAPQSRPIAADGGSHMLQIGAPILYRQWADGTVDGLRSSNNSGVVTVGSSGWITEPN